MNYGIPYKGSKNTIAEWVVSHFPPAEHLYVERSKKDRGKTFCPASICRIRKAWRVVFRQNLLFITNIIIVSKYCFLHINCPFKKKVTRK